VEKIISYALDRVIRGHQRSCRKKYYLYDNREITVCRK